MITPILVDARNYIQLMPEILEICLLKTEILGFDIETEDSNRHEGLNLFMKVNEEGQKSATRPLVFDNRRTNITGFSLYPKGHDKVWYFNLMHADVENRIPFAAVEPIFDHFPGMFVCHNGSFELTMVRSAWKKRLPNIICTYQLAVTAYGDDEYPIDKFYTLGTGAFEPIKGDILRKFANFTEITEDLTTSQGEILQKVIGKQSKAAWSYIGWIKQIRYGHGLKEAVQSWFNFRMVTFEEVLAGRAHMGLLTGEEVVSYGCDDAYWAVQLFDCLIAYLMDTNPDVISTFFETENPMVQVYSDTTFNGIRVKYAEVLERKEAEHRTAAPLLRELRTFLQGMKSRGEWFTPGLNEEYAKKDGWYGKLDKAGIAGGTKTREKINAWVNLGNNPDDYEEVASVNGGVATSWKTDRGEEKRKGLLNLTHYFIVRVLLYDLCGINAPVGRDKKVMSDGDMQQVLLEKYGAESNVGRIIQYLKRFTAIDQRMKLYITPYALLTDPETERLYPVLSCGLNTRRMASRFPNPMQLPKIGEGSYVRGFFMPDPGHLMVSHDWSQIELVRVAELSGDPEMLKCYQQRPYKDLHTIAVEAVMEFEEGYCAVLKKLPEMLTEYGEIQFIDNKGNRLSPQEYVKWLRRDIGKVSNFNYWYSGALAAIGEALGWTADKMWAATDRYRNKFWVGEEWRVQEQAKGEALGYVTLWDGHRRTRFERTPFWREEFMRKFELEPDGVRNFWALAAKKIFRRAGNQMVNALIQGDCATLAKRTVLRLNKEFEREIEKGWCRFVLPVHDELVHSVDIEFVPEFLERTRPIMLNHEDMFQRVVLDCSASIGLTYQPFDAHKAPLGQLELSELPNVDWIDDKFHGKGANELILGNALDYFKQRML